MERDDENSTTTVAERRTDLSQLEQCPGCYEFLPLSEFCDLDVELGPDAIAPHCLKCRTHGKPKPKFLNLTRRHRKAIACVLAAPSLPKGYKDAAKATGFSVAQIRDFFAGRRVPEFRACYQMALEAAGADIETVVKVQVDCLKADEYKYHPGDKAFVAFPDHRTRLRASQHVTKMLELEPPKQDGIQVNVGIKFNTNLGGGETYDPPNVMRARPVGPVVDVSNAD